MKFGVADYGLNVWYGGLYDLESRLQNLRELGFEGIERLEANGSGDALSKAALCRRCGMDFATCRGPDLAAGETLEENVSGRLASACRQEMSFLMTSGSKPRRSAYGSS